MSFSHTTSPKVPTRHATQDELAARVASGLETLDTQVDAFVRPMHAAHRTAPAANGGWSIDAILEHLCLTNVAYLDAMHSALEHAGAGAGAERTTGDWRPTLGGRLLVASMQSKWRLPAPKSIVPGPTPRARVLDALLGTHSVLRDLLRQAQGREWTRVRMVSPLSRLVRLNLGDAALVMLRHGERHAQQMDRVHRSLTA
jgi:hypothetical protein